MVGEKPGKKDKKDLIDRVVELVRLGHNDSQIGHALGIHRTTVKRYRERGEKRAIGTEARIRVVQESLSKHFDYLCQTCEKLLNATIITTRDKLERIIVEDLRTSQMLTKTLSGRRGDEVNVVLKVGGGKAELDHLSIEEELLFASLKQHTKNLDFWKSFKEWKDKSGEYISNLSGFYYLLRQRVMAETGLVIIDSNGKPGLTSQFARTIFIDTYDHALFGSKGFEGVAYAILPPRIDWHELRLNGHTMASASDKKLLEKCQELHSQMMDHFRDPRNHPQELQAGINIRLRLQKLESEIFLALQKLILKRSFLGRCDLCPD